MKFLLLLASLNWFIVTIQTKGGVRTKTTIQATNQHQAKQLSKQLYKNYTIISVTKK